MPLLLLTVLPALAGYGEPDFQGHPDYDERALALWVNAARVAPEEWDAMGMYDSAITPCSFSDFQGDEAEPQKPLYYSGDLGIAAGVHAEDMYDEAFVGSESSDGTSMEDRIAQFYGGSVIGEATAADHVTEYGVVLKNWMCDPAARAVLMSGDAKEIGTGEAGGYWTADFGGAKPATQSPVAQATHYWPGGEPGDTTFIMADWQGDRTPDVFHVAVDGYPTDLSLYWGDGHAGVWGAELDIGADQLENCKQYYLYWELADGTWGTYPENGSLTFGDRCEGERGYVDEQIGLEPPAEDEKGCASVSGRGGSFVLTMSGLLAVGLRRRR